MQPRQSTCGQQGGTPSPNMGRVEAQSWEGGVRGLSWTSGARSGYFSGTAVLGVLRIPGHPDLTQPAPDRVGERPPNYGVAPNPERERTGEVGCSHTKKRGPCSTTVRSPLAPEARVVQPDDPAPSPARGPGIRVAPLRADTPLPAQAPIPGPWSPTLGSAFCPKRVAAPRPRARRGTGVGFGGRGVPALWSPCPERAPAVGAAPLRVVSPGRAALPAPLAGDPATHATGPPLRPLARAGRGG